MRRILSAMLALVMAFGVVAFLPPLSAEAAGRSPYEYSVDNIEGNPERRVSGDKLGILRDIGVAHGEDLCLGGWFATPMGVQGYEYACTPVGGGTASWQAVKEAQIFSRPDLGKAEIPHPTGHGTAGFEITVPLSEIAEEGCYDVYLRARSTTGETMDFLALLRVRYGSPDVDDGSNRAVSFGRILREGEAAVRGAVTVLPGRIRLSPGGAVRLGTFHLPAYEAVTIRYITEAATESGGRRAVLGLKSAGEHPYGRLGEVYDMTDSLQYAPIEGGGVVRELTMELSEAEHSGELWLTGSLDGEVTVTDIVFAYNGKGTDRVAAKLYLSGDTTKYLSGQNAVWADGIHDPVVGDCLRIELTQDSNDPFVHFSAGLMLEEAGIRLDADEYKYMVLLLRAAPENLHEHMTLYLCSGAIAGATEACTHTFRLNRDGQWHYYLLDLTATGNWMGIINGWRFDIISGNSLVGNRVDVATVQFFRTPAAARAAAAEDPAGGTPYRAGDPAVMRDMREEAAAAEDYTIPPEDTYVETAPPAEPPTEPPTGAVTEPVGDPDTTLSDTGEAETSPAEMPRGRGCASVLTAFWPVAVGVIAAGGAILRRKRD